MTPEQKISKTAMQELIELVRPVQGETYISIETVLNKAKQLLEKEKEQPNADGITKFSQWLNERVESTEIDKDFYKKSPRVQGRLTAFREAKERFDKLLNSDMVTNGASQEQPNSKENDGKQNNL